MVKNRVHLVIIQKARDDKEHYTVRNFMGRAVTNKSVTVIKITETIGRKM